MKRAIPIIVVAGLAILFLIRLLTAPAGFAPGTRIEATSVSGLDRQEARRQVERENPGKPLRVFVRSKPIVFPPGDLGLKPQIGRALSRASGEQPSRIQRALWLGQGPDVPLFWRYNEAAIGEIMQELKDRVGRSPKDARIDFQGRELVALPGQSGRALQTRGLKEKLHQAAMAGGGVVFARTVVEEPRIQNREDLKRRYPNVLLVDKSDFTVSIYRGLQFDRSYPVAVGMPGFDTPEGWFEITSKSVDPAWLPPDWAGAQAGQLVPGGTPENPLVSRWLGIYDGVGIHGTRDTYSLGSAASHGCIRMDPEQVKELYSLVPMETPILIRP